MPQFLDLGLITIFSLVFFFTATPNPFARLLLRAWYLGAIIDFMFNTARGLIGACVATMDWSRFMLQSDISTGPFAVMTWAFWLAILSHLVWVNWSRWGREPVDGSSFWDYRWIAFLLGVLSLLAVLLSIFVNDPEIIKNSTAFIVPFVGQILALAWSWIYFGLTFKYQS